MCEPLSGSDLVQVLASESHHLSLNLTSPLALTIYSFFQILGKLVSLSVPQVSYLKNEPNKSFLVGFIGRLNMIMNVKSQAQCLGCASKNDSFHVNFSLLDPHYLAQGSTNMI